MYYDDHPPPHFHVEYGDDSATMDVDIMRITDGYLPPRVLAHEAPRSISPLE
jgi:hypothetical protein